MTYDELNVLIKRLVQLGEDKTELEYWLSIYRFMDKDEQEALVSNLIRELKSLSLGSSSAQYGSGQMINNGNE